MKKLTKILLVVMMAIVAVFLLLTYNNYQTFIQSRQQVQNENLLQNFSNGNLANIPQNLPLNNLPPKELDKNVPAPVALEEITDRAKIDAILSIAEKNELYAEYVKGKNFSVKVFDLTLEKRKQMPNQQDYANFPEKELFMAQFYSDEGGTYVLIADLDGEKVLSFKRIIMINMG